MSGDLEALVDAAMNAAARRRGVSFGAGTWRDVEDATAECAAARADLVAAMKGARELAEAVHVFLCEVDESERACRKAAAAAGYAFSPPTTPEIARLRAALRRARGEE